MPESSFSPFSPAAASIENRPKAKRVLLRFGLLFISLMAVYYVIVAIPFFDGLLFRYLSWNAWAASGVLNLLGQHTHAVENIVRSTRFVINVRRGCDALEPSWFLSAAIIAFPARIKYKAGGLLVGIGLICLVNIVRIASLYLIGLYWPQFFSPAHLEIWPVIFILLAVGLWLGWIGWTRARSSYA